MHKSVGHSNFCSCDPICNWNWRYWHWYWGIALGLTLLTTLLLVLIVPAVELKVLVHHSTNAGTGGTGICINCTGTEGTRTGADVTGSNIDSTTSVVYKGLQWKITAVPIVLSALRVLADTCHHPLANSIWYKGSNNLQEWFERDFGHGDDQTNNQVNLEQVSSWNSEQGRLLQNIFTFLATPVHTPYEMQPNIGEGLNRLNA